MPEIWPIGGLTVRPLLDILHEDSSVMLIRELAYDTESDELDLLIDTLAPEDAETIAAGDDIFLRRSIATGKIVGAVVANYSIWSPGRLSVCELDPDLADAHRHVVRYLEAVKLKVAS